MNFRIARNGLLVLALCASAFLVPAQKTVAQAQNVCQECMTYALLAYFQCLQNCPTCEAQCWGQYHEIERWCYENVC